MYVGGAYMEVRVQLVGIDPLLPQWGSQQWNQGHQIWGSHPSQLSHHLISFVHLSPTGGVKFLYQVPLNLHFPPHPLSPYVTLPLPPAEITLEFCCGFALKLLAAYRLGVPVYPQSLQQAALVG